MIRIITLLSLLMLTLWAAPTLKTMQKESRVAMVIGNSDYDEKEVPSARENAQKMKKFLEKNGFYVYYGENLDKRDFVHLLRKFHKNLRPNGIGLVYYSGHAVQTKGKNYLLPVESGILNEGMIVRKSISLNSIYSGMEESYDRLNIVVLDTAFKAPFGSLFSPKKKGLATIKSPKAQVTFMATSPNINNNSKTFTNDFLTVAQKKGLELTPLKTKLTPLRQTHRQNKPNINIAKNQPFYFVLPNRLPSEDELVYSKIKDSNSKNELTRFIKKYPKSSFAKKAQKQLNIIVQKETAAKEKQHQALEIKAAKAAQKVKEAEEREAARVAAEKPNDISFKLTKPENVVENTPVKPKEGEERQITLE